MLSRKKARMPDMFCGLLQYEALLTIQGIQEIQEIRENPLLRLVCLPAPKESGVLRTGSQGSKNGNEMNPTEDTGVTRNPQIVSTPFPNFA